MSKKHRLQLHKNSEKNNAGPRAFGLSSVEKDYRLAYFIGKELKLNLERSENSGVSKAGDIFQYEDEHQMRRLRFFSNRQIEGLLVPQLKEADYFALVYCLEEDNFVEEVEQALTRLQVIQSVFPLPAQYLKKVSEMSEQY